MEKRPNRWAEHNPHCMQETVRMRRCFLSKMRWINTEIKIEINKINKSIRNVSRSAEFIQRSQHNPLPFPFSFRKGETQRKAPFARALKDLNSWLCRRTPTLFLPGYGINAHMSTNRRAYRKKNLRNWLFYIIWFSLLSRSGKNEALVCCSEILHGAST